MKLKKKKKKKKKTFISGRLTRYRCWHVSWVQAFDGAMDTGPFVKGTGQ